MRHDRAIGITSVNRGYSLKRLLDSIDRATPDTLVFISDDNSDDKPTLAQLHDIERRSNVVLFRGSTRLGVAGNSNRLIKMMSRFTHKILLNDDVEIKSSDWFDFYINAAIDTGYHHFSYFDHGLYPKRLVSNLESVNGTVIQINKTMPMGVALYYDQSVDSRVGYMDRSFGAFGMEHVDWSNRTRLARLQPYSFCDVVGSVNRITLHHERSTRRFVQTARSDFRKAKRIYDENIENYNRTYINDSPDIPRTTVVVVDNGTLKSIDAVIQHINGQRLHCIDYIIASKSTHNSDNRAVKVVSHIDLLKAVQDVDSDAIIICDQGIIDMVVDLSSIRDSLLRKGAIGMSAEHGIVDINTPVADLRITGILKSRCSLNVLRSALTSMGVNL